MIIALAADLGSAEAAKNKGKRSVDCGPVASGGLNASAGRCFEYAEASLKVTVRRTSSGEKRIDKKAIAPVSAPPQVKRVINRANRIRNLPYNWGGGRATWPNIDKSGYDCSGSVSFALRGLGAKFLKDPLVSGSFENWGKPREGRWITVYAHGGHVYMEVAGLRFDTSGTGGNGPRWTDEAGPRSGFTVRHPHGF